MPASSRITSLDAVEIIGDLLAPVGSRYWCIGMRYEIQKLLDQHKTDHEGLQTCIDQFISEKAWSNLTDSRGKPFTSYAAFCKERRPLGLGRQPEEIDALLKEGAARETPQELAADPEVQPLAEHGGDRVEQGYDITLPRGTSASYLVRRLKRDAPEIAQELAQGKFPSARAAAIAAGIVRVPTALEVAQKAYLKLSTDDRERFVAWIGEQNEGEFRTDADPNADNVSRARTKGQ
jgi:hypothetical protein